LRACIPIALSRLRGFPRSGGLGRQSSTPGHYTASRDHERRGRRNIRVGFSGKPIYGSIDDLVLLRLLYFLLSDFSGAKYRLRSMRRNRELQEGRNRLPMQSRIQRYAQDDLAKSGLRGTRTMTSGSRLKGQLKVRVPLRTPSFLKYALTSARWLKALLLRGLLGFWHTVWLLLNRRSRPLNCGIGRKQFV